MFASLIRQSFQRLRRGPRRTSADYALFIPQRYLATWHAAFDSALALHAEGRVERAAVELRAATAKDPANAGLQALLGQVLHELGEGVDAEAALARARKLEPDIARTLAEEAFAPHLQRKQALGASLLAAQLAPESWVAKSRIADVYYAMGRLEEAASWVDAAYRQSGRDSLRLKRLLMQPSPIYRSIEHLRVVRDRYLSGLAELERSPLRVDNVLAEVNVSYFYLPYQGMNERDTQGRLARLFLKASPELGFVAQRCLQPAAPCERLRLGIASAYLGQRSSVGIAYNQLIRALGERDDIDLHLICFSEDAAAAARGVFGEHTPVVALAKLDLARSRERLAAVELDALLYADIGMDPFTYYLAFGRYAPLQGVLGGHPVTTGIPSLDVYISSRFQEAPQAQEHYTERLVRLEGFAMGMERPAPPPPRSRQQLGLPLSGNLYVCPLRIHRLHPEFDAALSGILDADEDAEIVLFEDLFHEAWDREVRSRLLRSLGGRAERVTFLPWQTPENFLAILATCQVALDSFHFGAGTTAPLAFAIGCPMVTLPSQFQRGRSTLAYYLAMQIDDCIAADLQDYVRIAVRIARDPQYRQALGARLRERSAVLFDAASSARELGGVLHKLCRERVACSPT